MKNFKLIFKSLISNPACVEGGRHRKWYFAVVIFVISILISLVPVFVQTITNNGDSIVANAQYGSDIALQEFTEDINEKKLSLATIESDNGRKMNISEALVSWNRLADAKEQGCTEYSFWGKDANGINCWSHKINDQKGTIDFQVYLLTAADYNNVEVLRKIAYVPSVDSEGKNVTVKRTGGYLLISEKSIAFYLQNVTLAKDVGSIYGNYNYVEKGFTINSLNGNKTYSEAIKIDPYSEYVNTTWSNWKKFFCDFYNDTRLNMTWQTTLLMMAVNVGLVLFMGLMIWILTRGKHNPFRIYTLWESLKISSWCSLTPAILTCGLSFLIPTFSQVFFALFVGVRVMWLSMKTLRPDAVAPADTKYNNKQVKTVDTKPAK